MSERWKFTVKQRGHVVASGDAPTEHQAVAEAMHYGLMYGQDGPAEVRAFKSRAKAQASAAPAEGEA